MILHLQMLTVQKAKKVLLNNSKYKNTAVYLVIKNQKYYELFHSGK